eukprot:PITA_19485
MHRKVLTWDNLRRKGFTVPLRCPLCQQDEETPKHLLNVCPFAFNVWNWMSLVFKSSGRDPYFIQNTFTNCRKACNARIFHGLSILEEFIIVKIKSALRETITSLPTQTLKARPTVREVRILSMLDLLHIKVRKVTPLPGHDNKNDTWKLPEQGTFKLNYDGTPKGNLGPAGFGGFFRNSKGQII